jgi:hypothetical protein
MITYPLQLRCVQTRHGLVLVALLFFSLALTVMGQEAAASVVSATAARPNLAPGNVHLNTYSARPGDLITVSWNMTNSGTAFSPASFTGLHLGTSPTTPPIGDSLSLTFVTPEIAPNSLARQTNTITVPFGMPLGNYYLWVVADESGFVSQTTRADDVARSAAVAVLNVIVQPNLVATNVTASASFARPGDQIAVAWTLGNAGNVTCPASITGLHLGTSATNPPASDGLNLKLQTPELNANSGIRFTNIVSIPANTTVGTYYLWVVADDVATSTINQSKRTDDAARSEAVAVVLVLPRPNLIPQDITLNSSMARPGDQITASWTVVNSGNANCAASTTGLHLGASATVPPASDGLNLKVPTPAIDVGNFVRQTNKFTIPTNTTVGNYYLWVVVDDVTNSTIDQSSRADDAARSELLAVVSVIPQPNLVTTNVVLSSQFAKPGDQVTAIWTITNSGTADCAASQTGLRLGTSATVRPTTGLAITVPTPAIGTNSFLRQTNVITIPASTPLGKYYLWVIADDVVHSTLNQSSKADDADVSDALTIVSVLPRPNLVPSGVVLSSNSAKPGDQLAVSWNMANIGDGTCPASVTGLHLGDLLTRPPNDPLNVSVPTPAINANDAVRQTNVVTIPASTPPGTYYIWVIADDVTNSTIDQSSRSDDAAKSAALAIAKVLLISPVSAATAEAPPTFEWNAQGTANATVYVSAKSSAVPGVDKVVFFESLSGTNKFRPSATNWATAVGTLGFAPFYFWTVGSVDPAGREIHAPWRDFRIIPMAVSATTSASNGQFQFQIAAPNTAQVVIEASDSLTNDWVQIGTVQNTTGTVNYTDPNAGTRSKLFFRAKP